MAHMPDDAFARYVALGPGRTYVTLAKQIGVSKRTVVRHAKAQGWQARLARVEDEAQRRTEERAVEDVVAIDEKHLRMARAIQARALEALKNTPIGNGNAAVRALDVAIKIERAILGREKGAGKEATLEDALIEARRRREERERLKPAPPPEPEVPPVLAPRVLSEN